MLRKLVASGFYGENLDKMVAECNALAQDSAYVLPFFVLKQVFADISAALDGEAVRADQFQEITAELTASLEPLLAAVEHNELIKYSDLETLVRTHLRNLSIFRSDR